ncbi:MAG: thiamine biosynthesis protein ThiS [Blastopirellula sp.]|nr:MAG: thiamine biosynthesis protein ThiS [Blastopirellula sp.]
MKIQLNEKPQEVQAGATVAQLIESLDLNPKHVAVEVNMELIPRTQHAEHELQEGDSLEVVTLVGGG